MFSTAFQANAFQINAFQIYIPPTPSGQIGGDGFTLEEWRRAQKLSKKIAERQRKLEQAIKESKDSRKQSIRNLVSPVKLKQTKLQLKQEVKTYKPSVDVQELQQSIAYLEAQNNNILQSVAHRKELLRIRSELIVLEAKRLAELDDEESFLALLM